MKIYSTFVSPSLATKYILRNSSGDIVSPSSQTCVVLMCDRSTSACCGRVTIYITATVIRNNFRYFKVAQNFKIAQDFQWRLTWCHYIIHIHWSRISIYGKNHDHLINKKGFNFPNEKFEDYWFLISNNWLKSWSFGSFNSYMWIDLRPMGKSEYKKWVYMSILSSFFFLLLHFL